MSAENMQVGDGSRPPNTSSNQSQGRVQGSWKENRGQQRFTNGSQYDAKRSYHERSQGQSFGPPRNDRNQQNFRNDRRYDNSRSYQSDSRHYNNYNSHQSSYYNNFHSNSNQSRGQHKDFSHISYPGDVEVSKEIVRIVRHGKYKWIKMDAEGYVKVNDILNDERFKGVCGELKFEHIQHIVDKNDKKRFEMREVDKEWYIKAVQGHTIQVESLALTPITDPNLYPNVFHGTYFEVWPEIQKTGLNRMKRNHIHFAIGLADDPNVVSGMRKSCEVAIEIEMSKAMEAGIKFFISSNKVILSEGDSKGRIHPKFFRRVIQIFPFQNITFKVPPDFDDDGFGDEQTARKQTSIPGYAQSTSTKFKAIASKSKQEQNVAPAQPPVETKPEQPQTAQNPPQMETKPIDSIPDTKQSDYFEDEGLSKKLEALSIRDDTPTSDKAQAESNESIEKKNLEHTEKPQAIALDEKDGKHDKTEYDAPDPSGAETKSKKRNRRGGKKGKNQDTSDKVPVSNPVVEVKFEMPSQCKTKQTGNQGEKSNEANKSDGAKSTKTSKSKNTKVNEQDSNKSQETTKGNAKEAGGGQRKRNKRKK